MQQVFSRLDTDHRHALTYSQFERFLHLNCFDFVLDFFDGSFIKSRIFKDHEGGEPRVTFSDILTFLNEQGSFKHSKEEYKESLTFFMRGSNGKQKANLDDVCQAMRKHTEMTDEEIKGYAAAHDMQLLVDTVREGEEELQMMGIEESAKLMYKY